MSRRRKNSASAIERNALYARAIGAASGEMALLENLLGELQAALLGIDARLGRAMYLSSHTAFGRLATLDATAAEVLPTASALRERIAAIVKRARPLLQGQHQMAHDIWRIAGRKSPSAMRKDIAAEVLVLAKRAREARDLAAEVRDAIESIRRRPRGAHVARVSA